MTQFQTMARVDHDYSRICNNISIITLAKYWYLYWYLYNRYWYWYLLVEYLIQDWLLLTDWVL